MEASKLRVGHIILINGEPFVLLSQMLRQQPRTVAKVIVKAKNIITGTTIEHTFTGSDLVEEANVEKVAATYLYNSSDEYFFMEEDTFEQFELPKTELGEQTKWMQDDMRVFVMKYDGKPISIELPPMVTMKVEETEPGVRGDSSTGKLKNAKVETGAEVKVPLFVNEGDLIIINTETGEYKARA